MNVTIQTNLYRQSEQSNEEDANSVNTDSLRLLENFLIEVERRALKIAQISVGEHQDALDIVQDTMIGFSKRYSHKPPEQWAPLFYKILYSRVNDWHRRSKVRRKWFVWTRHDSNEHDSIDTFTGPSASCPAQSLTNSEIRKFIITALKKLPKRQQQAFIMRSWEGLSVNETATAMGCSAGSVKTHLSRAMKTLRNSLGSIR